MANWWKKTPSAQAPLLAALLTSPLVLAAPQYHASVIEPREEIRSHHYADFNGDERRDLLLSVWSEERGRELLLYTQSDAGQFSATPARRIEVKKDIVAFAIGDIREEPGEELILLSRNAVYGYSTRHDGYAGNLKKLFDWELLVTVPSRKSLDFVGALRDYNDDAGLDLLLPGQNGYGLFVADGEGGFKAHTLPQPFQDLEGGRERAPGVSLSMEEGLNFIVETPSPFAGLFPDPQAQQRSRRISRFGDGPSILDVSRWSASVQPARLNEDSLTDFGYLDDSPGVSGAQRLNLVLQRDGGLAEQVSWQATLSTSDELLLADFNGDGLDDVIALQHKGSNESSILLYRNRGGEFQLESADQVLRFSGYEVEAEVGDLNADGLPELIVSYYSLAAGEALRSGSMLRTTLIYAGNKDESTPFGRRPNTRVEDKFSADSVKGLAERLHFSADLLGEGGKQVLGLDAQGALVARAIQDNWQIAAEPFWRFVPLQVVQSIYPLQFNTDARSDFILRHQNALTLLVSRP